MPQGSARQQTSQSLPLLADQNNPFSSCLRRCRGGDFTFTSSTRHHSTPPGRPQPTYVVHGNMAHRIGTLSRRQKPLQNRTPLIVYKHEVEDALEYIVETVDNAEGHKTLTALGVEKGEADVSPVILLSSPSGRRQGHQAWWQKEHFFAFSKGKHEKNDDARAEINIRIRQLTIVFGPSTSQSSSMPIKINRLSFLPTQLFAISSSS